MTPSLRAFLVLLAGSLGGIGQISTGLGQTATPAAETPAAGRPLRVSV